MRVAYLSSSTFPSRAANGVHVMKMSEAIHKLGADVDLYGYSLTSDYDYKHILNAYGLDCTFPICLSPLINRVPIHLAKLFAVLQMSRKISKQKYNLLYCRNIYAAYLCRKLDIPIIYETHDFSGSRLIRWMEHALFSSKNMVRLITITNALKEKYQAEYKNLKSEDILVAPDGATLGHAQPNPRKECKIIGYVGHLYEGRGIDIIIKLAEMLPSYRFFIIGGEDQHVLFWKEKSATLKNIEFLGYVPHADLDRYYQEMDILIAPYQKTIRISGNHGNTGNWCSPLKLFEYMAQRRPMIFSDLPVFKDILINNQNCLLCDCNDINQWKENIELLANDFFMRERLAETAYQDILMKYTWDIRAKQVLSGMDFSQEQ